MAPRVYYDNDADLSLLDGRTIAIIGYGAQGRPHALNLRDSGLDVIVGQRPGPSFERAQRDGFDPVSAAEAAAQAGIVNLMLPDEMHAEVYQADILPHLTPGNVLMCCHGFSIHFGYVEPPPLVEPVLVAPKGAGHAVRSEYERGSGVPCLVAVSETASDEAFQIGLAYAKGIGGTRRGAIQTSFAEETETDLFGEQAVLCGGISALIKAGYETLVEAGYQPEMAYFECLHETKLVVDLLYRGGLSYMRDHISNTAEYGDYTRGPRIINDQTRFEMKRILEEIRSGDFAKEWMREHRSGGKNMAKYRETEAGHPSEEVGRMLRHMIFDTDE